MQAFSIFMALLLVMFTANSSPISSTELTQRANSGFAPLVNLYQMVRADNENLRERLLNSSIKTVSSAKGFAGNHDASKVLSEFLSGAEERTEMDSKLSLLWLKLANVILPYKKTVEASKKQLKKSTKKFSVDQGELLTKANMRARKVMKTNEVPSTEHPVVGVIGKNSTDANLNANLGVNADVNISGFLSKLFGGSSEEEEEEEQGEVGAQDYCDDDEDDDESSCADDSDSDDEGYYSDRHGDYDTCIYSTGAAHTNGTSHGNHTHRPLGHRFRNQSRSLKKSFTLSNLSNYSNILGVFKFTSFGMLRFNYNGISGLVIGLLAAIIFA